MTGSNENAGVATITVSRVNGSTGAVSVSYVTADGTAVHAVDYRAQAGTLAWADGDTTDKTFDVPLIDHHLTTGAVVSLSLTLSAPTGGAVLNTLSQASVNITRNESITQPTVLLTSPPSGLSVVAGASLPLAANINDPSGLLTQLQFQIDGTQVGMTTAAGPYTFNATAPTILGAHQITAIAIDNQGRQNTSSVSVTVTAANPSKPAPTVAIVTSLDQRSLAAGSTVTLDAAATAADGTPLQRVDFYANGTLFASLDGSGNVISSIYPVTNRPTRRDAPGAVAGNGVFQTNFVLPGTDTFINLIAVALDQLGQSQVSAPATVHSVAATNDHPPAVTLTDVTNGAPVKIGTALSLPLAVSDPDTSGGNSIIAQVEYFVNTDQAQVLTAAPFIDFSFTPTASGKYVLSAVATDDGGLAGFSDPVTINAFETPTVTIAAGGNGMAVEGGAKGKVIITRTGDTSTALTVNYKAKGPAKAGVDYKALSGSVTLPVGAATAKIKIKPISGSPDHGTLKIKLVLKPAADGSYEVGSPSRANILLIEND